MPSFKNSPFEGGKGDVSVDTNLLNLRALSFLLEQHPPKCPFKGGLGRKNIAAYCRRLNG
jgi:hypothetical protein